MQYTPREQTKEGRLFEHAADSRVLVDHLLNASLNSAAFADDSFTPYFIKVSDQRPEEDRLLMLEDHMTKAATEVGVTSANQIMEIN